MKRIPFILLRYAAAFAAFVFFWWLGAAALGPFLLPSPAEVIPAWIDALGGPELQGHAAASFRRVALSLALAWCTAFPLGILLGWRRHIDRFVSPLVFLTYPLPKVVLLPVFLTLFGLGDLSKVLLISLTAAYQILVVTRDSIRKLDARYIASFMSLGGTQAQLLRHVLIPAALPDALTSLKVASGTAVAVLFMVESFATRSGLGFSIMDAWGRGDQTEMFCGILSMMLLGLAVYETFHIAEKVFCRWKSVESGRQAG